MRGARPGRAMSQLEADIATRDMSSETTAPSRTILERPAAVRTRSRGRPAAIELVDLEGLALKEAALALGVSGVTFRKRLSRARARLRKEHPNND